MAFGGSAVGVLPTLHVTVREGSVTISIDKQEHKDAGVEHRAETDGGVLQDQSNAG